MNLDLLKAPFSPTLISWRVGATNGEKTKGIALAYLNARDVMERLDEVCGPGNWQARYPFIGCCDIGIYIPGKVIPLNGPILQGGWVWKSNGAGQSDIEAEKGQYSDAFKRAAVLWGIGRYLYDLPNTWYPIEPRGKSYIFTKEAEAQMTQALYNWQQERLWKSSVERKKILESIDNCWASKDTEALKVIWGGLDDEKKMDVWGAFREFSAKRNELKIMLGVK